jgi:hypothetical protein
MTRMFTAAAIAALMAGSALAQTPPTSSSMAEPQHKSQDANLSTGNPETGDATISADGRAIEPEGNMAAQSDMSAQAGVAGTTDQGQWSGQAAGASTTTGAYGSGAMTSATGAVTTRVVTNGPVPDTRENRARYGQPLSRAGKRTAPAGN